MIAERTKTECASHAESDIDNDDPLAPARGILIAALISIPIWITLGMLFVNC